jgi:hypothetical protein
MNVFRSLLLLTLFVLSTVCSLAQGGAVVLLKGKVLRNGAGERLEMSFKNTAGGPSARATTASDGSYQITLMPGATYKIVITDDNLVTHDFSYTIPAYDRYTELELDLPIGNDFSSTTTTKTKKTKTKKSKKSKK